MKEIIVYLYEINYFYAIGTAISSIFIYSFTTILFTHYIYTCKYNYTAEYGADQRCLRGSGIGIHRGGNNTMHQYGSAGSGVPARFCPSAVNLINYNLF